MGPTRSRAGGNFGAAAWAGAGIGASSSISRGPADRVFGFGFGLMHRHAKRRQPRRENGVPVGHAIQHARGGTTQARDHAPRAKYIAKFAGRLVWTAFSET